MASPLKWDDMGVGKKWHPRKVVDCNELSRSVSPIGHFPGPRMYRWI